MITVLVKIAVPALLVPAINPVENRVTAVYQFVLTGGPVVWILLGFSVVACTVALLKIWQFWGEQKLASDDAERAMAELEQGSKSRALLLLKGSRNPQAQVLKQVLQLPADSISTEASKAECWRVARAKIADLGSYLRVLEVIATLAPLLGLFGTVLGMIEAFRAMEAAGARVDPSILSGGIWQALLTTAVGLAVAIPVSMLHSWLERRVEVEAAAMQDKLERVFTLRAVAAADAEPVAKSAS